MIFDVDSKYNVNNKQKIKRIKLNITLLFQSIIVFYLLLLNLFLLNYLVEFTRKSQCTHTLVEVAMFMTIFQICDFVTICPCNFDHK